jgi:hyperosmotically inducible periplasmic protein
MSSRLLRAILLCVSMTASIASYAQSSDAQPAPQTASAPKATTKKATSADRALAKAVRRALGKAQGINVADIFVRARDGAVTLSGSVRSADQIQQAETVTRSVQGVTSVTNKLTLFHGGNG